MDDEAGTKGNDKDHANDVNAKPVGAADSCSRHPKIATVDGDETCRETHLTQAEYDFLSGAVKACGDEYAVNLPLIKCLKEYPQPGVAKVYQTVLQYNHRLSSGKLSGEQAAKVRLAIMRIAEELLATMPCILNAPFP